MTLTILLPLPPVLGSQGVPLLVYVVLGTEPRTPYMLGKLSVSEPHPQFMDFERKCDIVSVIQKAVPLSRESPACTLLGPLLPM